METKDKKRFATALAVMGEVFQKKPSDSLTEIYWKTLQDLSIETFERACSTIINARTITGTFPLVAEIREAAGGGKQSLGLRTIEAWDKLEYALRRHGYYDSVIFDDPIIHAILRSWGGWVEWSGNRDMKEEDLKWVRKDFEKMYAALSNRESHEPPDVCVGFIEARNTRTGYSQHIPAPFLVKTHHGRPVSLPQPGQGVIGMDPQADLQMEIRRITDETLPGGRKFKGGVIMPIESDKCPFCGRGRDHGDPRGISYECGTLDNDPLPRVFQCMRDWACNLQAENEDLKDRWASEWWYPGEGGG
jgi:hypothetical protein